MTPDEDRPAEGADPRPAPYVPFPDFIDWGFGNWNSPTFDQYEHLLAETRASSDQAALEAAVQTATRYAAIDTGAIEGLYETDRGFTRTVAIKAAAWEAALDARGERTRRAIEDALRAYDFVLDAATRRVPVTEALIRQLHEVLCASQYTFTVYTSVGPQEQPLPKGEYKTQPNSPTLASGALHAYAPVLDTPAEMGRLTRQLSSEAFGQAHPVIQAAYAHYGFVCVHPFADGNGRVARALASIFLYRRPGVPLVVFADQKAEYLDALESADRGHPASFVAFVEQRVLDAVELVRTHVRPPHRPSIDEALGQVSSALTGRGGLPHLELDAVASRVLTTVQTELEATLAEVELPSSVAHEVRRGNGVSMAPPDGYRGVPSSPQHIRVRLTASAPASSAVDAMITIFPAQAANVRADFLVVADRGELPLEVRLQDAHPSETNVLRLKANAWARAQVEHMVALLANVAREVLRQGGYLPHGTPQPHENDQPT